MTLPEVVIILCRPEEPGNIGAVCRAMKNMGLSRLRLVAPANLDESVIRARAVHAVDLWESAGRFGSLSEAAADCSLVAGTTRRRGRHRKALTMTPGELAAFFAPRPGPAALVFGNERTGLEDGELELCTLASHIPVAPEFPSLNLSHAVQVYAYELFKNLGGSGNPKGDGNAPPLNDVLGQWVPMTSAESAALAKRVSGSLEKLGFYKHPGREEQELFLRDLFARAGLTLSEGRYLGNVIAKAARLAKEGPKRRTAD